jgi:integrase
LARPDADRLATTLAELTIGNLIDDYMKAVARTSGRGKLGCLQILKREIGSVPVTALSALTLREFTDRRLVQGAGGHTIGKDLSAFSAFLKWARGEKGLPVPKGLVIDARRGLECRGLSTVSKWRGREPTDAEMERLYAHWLAKPRQRIDMVMLCKFALATGMGQEAICELRVEDVNTETHTIIVSRGADAGGSAQVVPLLTNAWALLQPLLEGRKGGTVFGAYAPSVSVAFTRACHALAIHDLRFQDLRHRATAELFRMGLDVDKIAELTGRKTTSRLHRHKPADV